MNTNDLYTGKYADLLPDMGDQEFDQLKASIAEHGFDVTEPIKVTPEGEIVDGHHRYRACEELGVEPEIVVVEDPSVEHAIRTNLARRDHDSGQKRDVVVNWLLSDRYDADDMSQRAVAETLGVSRQTVNRAIKEAFPERYEDDSEEPEEPDGVTPVTQDGADGSQEPNTSTNKPRSEQPAPEPTPNPTPEDVSDAEPDTAAQSTDGGTVAAATGTNDIGADPGAGELEAENRRLEARVEELEGAIRAFVRAVDDQDVERITATAEQAEALL